MRIRDTLKNSIYNILSYALLAIITFYSRKVFIEYLSVELLGCDGLFANIFSVLAVSELGIDAFILYRMYPAVIRNDKEYISKLMNIFRVLYKCVGLFVLVAGLFAIPFLKVIIKETSLSWLYIYSVYLIQLSSILITYFLSYKRLILTVNQKEYICIKIDTICTVIANLVKIVIIILFRNYTMCLLTALVIRLLSNLLIAKNVNKYYPYLRKREKVSLNEIKQLGILNEMKNNSVHKVCEVVFTSTDNILISFLMGIEMVGLVSNYTIIITQLSSLIIKTLKSFQISIGNYINSESYEDGYNLFKMFDLISFYIASIIFCGLVNCLNPFIIIWLGETYIFDIGFVIALSFNQYILWNHHFLCSFRYAFGNYEIDRNYVVIGTVLNIVCSLVFYKTLGITGVIIGTILGHVGIWLGRAKALYTCYIKEKLQLYIIRQVVRVFLLILEALLCYMLCINLRNSFIGLFLKAIVSCLVSFLVTSLAYCRSNEVKMIFNYIRRILKKRSK